MTVYVTQEPVVFENGQRRMKFDIRPATAYGDIVFLNPDGPISYAAGPMLLNMREQLRDFDPAEDYILPVGDPAIMVATGFLLHSMGWNWFRLLKWDHHTRRYTAIRYNVNGGNDDWTD
jgi:hypothetical protein